MTGVVSRKRIPFFHNLVKCLALGSFKTAIILVNRGKLANYVLETGLFGKEAGVSLAIPSFFLGVSFLASPRVAVVFGYVLGNAPPISLTWGLDCFFVVEQAGH